MFNLFKNKKQEPVRDMLVRDLMKAIMDFNDDYKKLSNDYKKLADMYSDLLHQHTKLVKCVANYLECGCSDKFWLLLKEHMIGEESGVSKDVGKYRL